MEVYIVSFETGEYSDHQEFVVGVLDSKEKADAFTDEKRKRLDKLGLHANGDDRNVRNYDARFSEEIQKEFPNMYISYTGAWYSITGPYPVL